MRGRKNREGMRLPLGALGANVLWKAIWLIDYVDKLLQLSPQAGRCNIQPLSEVRFRERIEIGVTFGQVPMELASEFAEWERQ